MQGRRHREHGKDAQRSHARRDLAPQGRIGYPNTCQRAPGGSELTNELRYERYERKAGDPSAGRVFTSTGPGAVPRGLGRFRFRLLAVALAVAAGQGEQLHEQQRLYGEIHGRYRGDTGEM